MNCFLFEGLPEKDLQSIYNTLGNKVTVNKGGELYRNSHIGILSSGSAVIKRRSNLGEEITIRNICVGEIFGAASVFGNWQEGFSSITAKSDCELYYISEEKFRKIIKKFPNIAFNYIKFLTERIRFLNSRIDALSADSTQHRLYEFLISQADENSCVTLDFGLAELARRLQVGRSSLYRDIEKLENSGLISRDNKKFKIINFERKDLL